MTCKRCHGLLVEEWRYALLDTNLELWRCVCCGNLVDSVILKNQQEQETHRTTMHQA